MRVLLVESTPGNAVEVREWLESEGHAALTCFESPVTFGCRGVGRHEDCPLEGTVDVAMLVRDLDGHGHTLTEMGAVCAMRHRVPVVEITEPHHNHLDATMRTALAGSADPTLVDGYERAARAGLHDAPGVADLEVSGIDVVHEGLHVRATLHVGAGVDDARLPMLVDRVGRALRRHDPYASVIDVGVHRG